MGGHPEQKPIDLIVYFARLCHTLCNKHFHSQDSQADIKKRCINADPKHGEFWCQVSKDIKNWRLRTEQILPLVAECLPLPT